MLRDPALQRACAATIKEERIRQGLSRRALSKKLNQFDNFIRDIENGNHAVKFDEFVLISEALGMAPSRLMVRAIRKARGKG